MELCPFYRNKLLPQIIKDKLADKWINYSIGKDVIVTSNFGKGKAVAFGGHPEMYRSNDQPRIVFNSIFFLTSEKEKQILINNSIEIEKNNVLYKKEEVEKSDINHPPNKPYIEYLSEYGSSGPGVVIGEMYFYKFRATDPDDDKMWIKFEYKGIISNWTEANLSSNETFVMWGMKMNEGDYKYRVQAIDEKGAESEWSDNITIHVEKGNLLDTPILIFTRFLIRHQNMFPIIRKLFTL